MQIGRTRVTWALSSALVAYGKTKDEADIMADAWQAKNPDHDWHVGGYDSSDLLDLAYDLTHPGEGQ